MRGRALLRGSRILRGGRSFGGAALRLLDVRPVRTGGAGDDRVLAGVGDHHEFVRARAADVPRVRLYGAKIEPHPAEDPAIGVVHLFVRLHRPLLVRVERVGVLHEELPAAHQPEAGTDLVAELVLDLVEGERQLPVRPDLPPHEIGDHLFMGGSEAELPVRPVLESQQLLPVGVPPAALLPELGRHHRGHQDLQRSRPVHLLAQDPLHLAKDPQPRGQVVVDPRSHFPEEPRAQHQPVADDLRVGRRLLGGRHQITGIPDHAFLLLSA